MKRPSLSRFFSIPASLGACLLLLGCDGAPATIPPPEWKPQEQAAAGLALYDKDGDGKISGPEMSPGLKAALDGIDTDGDKAISQEELAARIQGFADTKLGLVGVGGRIMQSGRPAAGAEVTFIPEPFLEGVILPARGTVGPDGSYSMRTEGQDFDAVQPGIYSVSVSKKSDSGTEAIPSRYNSKTELGAEVGRIETAQSRGTDQYDWNL